MENTPTAPAEATKAPESVETPTNTNPAPAQAPDMYGFTSEQLADMKKFFDNNGGFDGVKAKISNPEKPVEKPVENSQPEPQTQNEPTSHTESQPTQGHYQVPKGAITPSEFLAEQYFKSLAGEQKYETISDGIRNGDYLKEMAAFGIQALNQDGSINDQKVRMYLDLKAQTVPAKPTSSEPNASAAPTVSYTGVGEGGLTDINQAYKIIMEPGNPNIAKAEEFIKNHFNPDASKK